MSWQHYTGNVSHALHAKLGESPSWHSGAWYALQGNKVLVHAPIGLGRGVPYMHSSVPVHQCPTGLMWNGMRCVSRTDPNSGGAPGHIWDGREWVLAKLRSDPTRSGIGGTSGVNTIVADPSGAANDTLTAASALLTAFTANSTGTVSDCANTAISGPVSAFQAAANASGISAASSAGGAIAVDGEYGPQTAAVLQDVIDGAQAAGIPITANPAPAAMFGTGNRCASAPAPVPVPVPNPVTPATPTVVNNTTTTTTATPSSNVVPILVGTAVVLGLGAGAYYMMKKHPHGRRHAHA